MVSNGCYYPCKLVFYSYQFLKIKTSNSDKKLITNDKYDLKCCFWMKKIMFAFVNLIVLIKFLLLDIKMHSNKCDYINKKSTTNKSKFCINHWENKLGLKMNPPHKIYEMGTTF